MTTVVVIRMGSSPPNPMRKKHLRNAEASTESTFYLTEGQRGRQTSPERRVQSSGSGFLVLLQMRGMEFLHLLFLLPVVPMDRKEQRRG